MSVASTIWLYYENVLKHWHPYYKLDITNPYDIHTLTIYKNKMHLLRKWSITESRSFMQHICMQKCLTQTAKLIVYVDVVISTLLYDYPDKSSSQISYLSKSKWIPRFGYYDQFKNTIMRTGIDTVNWETNAVERSNWIKDRKRYQRKAKRLHP